MNCFDDILISSLGNYLLVTKAPKRSIIFFKLQEIKILDKIKFGI